MIDIKNICAKIATNCLQNNLKTLATQLADSFNIGATKSFERASELVYWLYIYDHKEMCFDLCSQICNADLSLHAHIDPYLKNIINEYLKNIVALYTKFQRERGNIKEAQWCIENFCANYSRPEMLSIVLEEPLPYGEQVELAKSMNNVEAERNYKFAQFKILCFILALGGSHLFPKEKTESEMNQLKSDLLRLQQLADGEKNTDYSSRMQTGASDADIEKLTTIFGKLPTQFIDFYKIHNGQIPYTEGIIDYEELLSIDEILEEWNAKKDYVTSKNFDLDFKSSPDPGIKNDWYNLRWLPLTSNGSGDNYCLDLDPSPEGKYGQVIRVWHDDAIRTVEASSFNLFLEYFLGKDYLKKMQ